VRNKLVALSALAGITGILAASPALARDHIKIVGSSTVYPYAQAVSEEFARTGNKAPVLESTGSGGGMKLFCQGIGEAHPDITNASRAMKKSEWELCNKNGVKDITEVLIGYDGLSVALSRKGADMDLTKEQLYLALAKEIPMDGKLVANPNKKWSDIDKSLPNVEIIAYGPPPTSGTRDAFVELAMHKGCESLPFFKAKKKELDKKAYKSLIKSACGAMRQDGPFIEAGENDNLIVQRLDADSNAVGIFGYSFLFENQDKLKAVKIKGVEPSMETIGDGSYGISRPLFFYIKNAHRKVIPGMNEYIKAFVSDDAMGPGGYLSERGLVTLPDDKLKAVQKAATDSSGMTRYTN
jgi:phosphate transport system substrate-binding protein